MPRPLIPPHYINVPVGIVYDKEVPPQVLATYIQIRGMAWGDAETPELSVKKLCEITGKSRATIYGHLAILRIRGWLLFSSAHHSGLTVRFVESDAAHDYLLSKNLDSLNEDVLSTDSITRIIKHPPPVNQKNRARSVQNSGQESSNLDSNNGWHEIIDGDLEQLLGRIGVFPTLFSEIAASGWDTWQLEELAQKVLDDLGPGAGGGVFMYRLANQKPPLTAEEQDAVQRRELLASWEKFGVQH